MKNPNMTHREIQKEFNIAKSTVSYHLTKLVKHEILSVESSRKNKKYKVFNEKEIVNLLIKYKPYSRIKSFKDKWVDLKWPGVKEY